MIRVYSVTFRSLSLVAPVVMALALMPASSALATNSSARPATKSERAAIMAAFTANDGSSSEVHGVYVSRSNSSLAVGGGRAPRDRLAGGGVKTGGQNTEFQ